MKATIRKASSHYNENENKETKISDLKQLLALLDKYENPIIIEYAEKYIIDVPMSDTQPFNKGHYEKVKSKLLITVYDDHLE